MTQSERIAAVYRHLVHDVLPRGRVTTYGEIAAATGIKMGPGGRPLPLVLHAILQRCDELKLPPLTAIVVRKGSERDGGRHGNVGRGYFEGEAKSPNNSGRFRSEEFKAIATGGELRIDKDAKVPEFRSMVDVHQDSVWAHKDWPMEL